MRWTLYSFLIDSEAYKVASLGVPMNDWKSLANAALEGMDFSIARKAFSKTKNLSFLRLIEQYQVSFYVRLIHISLLCWLVGKLSEK